MIAYTIGQEPSYDKSLAEEEATKKTGERPDWDPPYEGGWVWRTAEEAQSYILREGSRLEFRAAVYELELPGPSWAECVRPSPLEGEPGNLLRDSLIVRKIY